MAPLHFRGFHPCTSGDFCLATLPTPILQQTPPRGVPHAAKNFLPRDVTIAMEDHHEMVHPRQADGAHITGHWGTSFLATTTRLSSRRGGAPHFVRSAPAPWGRRVGRAGRNIPLLAGKDPIRRGGSVAKVRSMLQAPGDQDPDRDVAKGRGPRKMTPEGSHLLR